MHVTQMQEGVVNTLPQGAEVDRVAAERMHPVARRIVGGLMAGGLVVAGVVTLSNENVRQGIEDAGHTAWTHVVDTFVDPLFDNQN